MEDHFPIRPATTLDAMSLDAMNLDAMNRVSTDDAGLTTFRQFTAHLRSPYDLRLATYDFITALPACNASLYVRMTRSRANSWSIMGSG